MADDSAPDAGAHARPDPTAELKVRTRRRLIGAAALLLAVIVIVPAVLDPTPKPLPDAIPIEIPSEKTPFTPRLSLPPLPEPAAASVPDGSVTPDTKAGESKDRDAPAKRSPAAEAVKPARPAEAKPVDRSSVEPKPPAPKAADTKAPDASGVDAKAAEAKRARDLLEGRVEAAGKTKDAKGRFVLQAAASSNEAAARDLAERIASAGLTSYVEKFESKDGVRFRVRVGPYASRDEAERARARLRALDVNANLVAL